jgi:hypothetical protein
VQWER